MQENELILSTRDHWTEKEIKSLFDYCKKTKNIIIKNLLANINEKKINKNLKRGFFPKMADFIKTKNTKQCKSKYQKKRDFIIMIFLKKKDLFEKYKDSQEIKKKTKKKEIEKNKILKSKNTFEDEILFEESLVKNKKSDFIRDLENRFEASRNLSNINSY